MLTILGHMEGEKIIFNYTYFKACSLTPERPGIEILIKKQLFVTIYI